MCSPAESYLKNTESNGGPRPCATCRWSVEEFTRHVCEAPQASRSLSSACDYQRQTGLIHAAVSAFAGAPLCGPKGAWYEKQPSAVM